jgi:hypothetical protein
MFMAKQYRRVRAPMEPSRPDTSFGETTTGRTSVSLPSTDESGPSRSRTGFGILGIGLAIWGGRSLNHTSFHGLNKRLAPYLQLNHTSFHGLNKRLAPYLAGTLSG